MKGTTKRPGLNVPFSEKGSVLNGVRYCLWEIREAQVKGKNKFWGRRWLGAISATEGTWAGVNRTFLREKGLSPEICYQ